MRDLAQTLRNEIIVAFNCYKEVEQSESFENWLANEIYNVFEQTPFVNYPQIDTEANRLDFCYQASLIIDTEFEKYDNKTIVMNMIENVRVDSRAKHIFKIEIDQYLQTNAPVVVYEKTDAQLFDLIDDYEGETENNQQIVIKHFESILNSFQSELRYFQN